ncbi:twin-arginine translocation signal domain-containing protein [Natronoglomus mannanivorans]|uniref:Twin-arginine translocation signal domain-containing protein n=1 Tax=Natronoglomus mannanivorans TaxID=2979990 RepID=A0AAP2Z0T4_9EURY|nr:twin-arginine translocation signal domain-containing protein [Halobacteria archaeon AArc-xg1-1]
MNRRGFLQGTGVAGAIGLAGCLERLGFEEQSAWRDPPLVEDRPDAVYFPASRETMGSYGTATDGEYAVALSYTFPHRFWTIAGDETNRVTVDTEDTMHLMCTVWDPETDTVLPVEMELEIRQDGASVDRPLAWPMLSQRMGFHYGDNVQLPDDGEYTARILVGPLEATPTGAFEGRFESASTLEIDFEYDRSDIHDLEFEETDYDDWGSRAALELMDHGSSDGGHAHEHDDHSHGDDGNHGDDDGHDGHDHDDENHDHGDHDDDVGHPPTSRGPTIDDFDGELLGSESSADATISAVRTNVDRLLEDNDGESDAVADSDTGTSTYIAVFTRTPYNDVILPLMSLSMSVERDGAVVHEGSLRETLDHEFGHHYGVTVDDLERGDRLQVSVDSHPQLARHDGYETAFFEFDDVVFSV